MLEHPRLESLFNENTYFLITPQNQTTLCSLVFYKTFFGVELSFFSESAKVIFWTNCAFPLILFTLSIIIFDLQIHYFPFNKCLLAHFAN